MRMHVIVFLVVIPQAALAYPIITEIMPNPDDDCMDCSEWVEILSESHTNITLTTCGKVVNVSLNKGYNVITRNRDKFISIWNISSNIIEAPILLKNSGCEVQLLVNSTHID
ncbi:MAG TPA: hypothetical protein ENG42_02395, partial [Candidatus Aenigmarchaeota archaeon]|nr:hypothetical protein [Candidatus Aenigmarchaeota archaeon]